MSATIAPSQQLRALGAVYLQRYSATPTLIYLSLQHFANISVGSAEYLCRIAAVPTVYREGLLRLVVPEEPPAIKVYRPLSNLVVKWIGAGQNRVIF